jgi:hypothetical protein
MHYSKFGGQCLSCRAAVVKALTNGPLIALVALLGIFILREHVIRKVIGLVMALAALAVLAAS